MINIEEVNNEQCLEKISKLNNGELIKMISEKNNFIKKLMVKSYNIDSDLTEVNKKINNYESNILDLKNNTKYNSTLLFKEKIRNLNTIINELIDKNIDLDNKIMSTTFDKTTPKIDYIIEDYKSKVILEMDKSKKVNLYMKKEYAYSNNKQIEILNTSISETKQDIQNFLKKIENFEDKNQTLMTSLGTYKRLYKQMKKENN